MKKALLTLLVCLLTVALFVGCASDATTETSTTGATTPTETKPTEEITEKTEEDLGYSKNLYAAQIERYFLAVSEKWDEGSCLENGISPLVSYYYEGNALENVGYTFIDFDNNGTSELVIGAIMNADVDPIVFEIYTLKNDEAVSLAQSGSRKRYFLQ